MHSGKQSTKKARTSRILALLVAPLMFVLVANAGQANAAWRNGPLLNLHYYQCLDTGPGHLQEYVCNGSGAQLFRDISSASTYQFYNPGMNECIDSGASPTGYLWPCNGGAWQQFRLGYVKTGWDGLVYYQIRDTLSGNYCLDANTGSHVNMQPCNGGDYQLWTWM